MMTIAGWFMRTALALGAARTGSLAIAPEERSPTPYVHTAYGYGQTICQGRLLGRSRRRPHRGRGAAPCAVAAGRKPYRETGPEDRLMDCLIACLGGLNLGSEGSEGGGWRRGTGGIIWPCSCVYARQGGGGWPEKEGSRKSGRRDDETLCAAGGLGQVSGRLGSSRCAHRIICHEGGGWVAVRLIAHGKQIAVGGRVVVYQDASEDARLAWYRGGGGMNYILDGVLDGVLDGDHGN